MRPSLVLLHRWTGLATALFLVVAGLTGSALAFKDELEALINPRLFVADQRSGPMLDPFALREAVQRRFPDGRVDYMPFTRPGRTAMFYLMPRPDAATGEIKQPAVDQVFVDPRSGEILGARKWGALFDGGRFRRENIVPFLWRLHEALALPHPYGKIFFGLVALLWTIDCFIGFALTLPRGKPLWTKWSRAWRIKQRAAPYRRNLDLHRAFGLWLWATLLVLAWSSVMLNLREAVYRPVMSLALPFAPSIDRQLPAPAYAPVLDWREARAAGRHALERIMAEKGAFALREDSLWYRPALGAYLYRTHTSLDIRDTGGASDLWIDGKTGELLHAEFERSGAAGNVVSEWLRALHMATIWGLPYRLFIAALGGVVAMLSVTGIYIWWKKRAARITRRKERRNMRCERRAGG